MTTQEAIKQLKDLIEDRMSLLTGDEEHDEVFLADMLALHIATSALEKQIPIEVKRYGVEDEYNVEIVDYDTANCPCCGSLLDVYCDDHVSCCSTCGQALDWSDYLE